MGCTVTVARGNAVNRADAVGRADVARSVESICYRWWEAGGASGAVVAYQAKSVASYAISKVNLANPGTNDATEGVAPTWDTNGWAFNGSSQYLRSGIVVSSNYSIMIQFSNYAGSAGRSFFGAFDTGAFLIQHNTNVVRYYNGVQADFSPAPPVAGNLAIAQYQPYRDGVAEAGTIASGFAVPTGQIYISCINSSGVAAQFAAMTVRAFAIYNNTLNAAQVAAVAAAMAAL